MEATVSSRRTRSGSGALVAVGALVVSLGLAMTAAVAAPSPRNAAPRSAEATDGAAVARDGGRRAPAPSSTTPALDALWAISPPNSNYNYGTFSVCQQPTVSPVVNLGGCFAADTRQSLWDGYGSNYQPATDGVNVYMGQPDGMSCPVGGYGQNCTDVQIGWGGVTNPWKPTTVAAGAGYLYLGGYYSSNNVGGYIYRCPSDLPYTGATSQPSECVILDDAGNRWVKQIVYANDALYVALGNTNGNGMIWKCDPIEVGHCITLNTLDQHVTGVRNDRPDSIAVGGGYLWVGMLMSHRIYRCDPEIANTCEVWETAGDAVISLADDGQGTLWAAVGIGSLYKADKVIWSCPEAKANSCSAFVKNILPWQVTAGAGLGFFAFFPNDQCDLCMSPTIGASSPPPGQSYPNSSVWDVNDTDGPVQILYIPAGGPTQLGRIRGSLTVPEKLEKQCAKRKQVTARVTVSGPYEMQVQRKIDVCATKDSGFDGLRFGALNPGEYTVAVRAENFRFAGTATVSGGLTEITLN